LSNQTVSCPALVIAAPSSGSGKTTVVAALARYYTSQGKKVAVFKTGPDFIDPHFLAFASNNPVYQLDFWMCGKEHCKALVAKAAKTADLILIEGVMGMFDGQCSTADIAIELGIPVMAVIDAKAMAQTFGALAYGLAYFRKDVTMYGVFANRVGSDRHATMLMEELPNSLEFCGYLKKDSAIELPERHLGLVQAQELQDLEQRLDLVAESIGNNHALVLPPPVEFECVEEATIEKALLGVRIAVAQDTAFSFIYQANLDCLQQLGAEIEFFSPVKGNELPSCDALYLPGGYPELHLEALSNNQTLIKQIQQHAKSKPILAECGGMIYLSQYLTGIHDESEAVALCGVLKASVKMQPRLAALGLVEANFSNAELRGHTFHYSKTESLEKVFSIPIAQSGRQMDPVWVKNKVVASYIHWYFPFNPELVATIFKGEL
jgi:cobyrinic acid a,c-diamide synthase